MGTTSEERSPASQEVRVSLDGPTPAHLSGCRSSLIFMSLVLVVEYPLL